MSETKIKVPEERLLRVVDKVGSSPTVRECCTAFAEDLSENPIVPNEADVMEILQERVRSHHISGEEYCAIPPATVRFVIREWQRRMFLASPEPCDNPVVQRVVQRGQRFKVGDDIWQVKFQNGDMATLEKIAPEPEVPEVRKRSKIYSKDPKSLALAQENQLARYPSLPSRPAIEVILSVGCAKMLRILRILIKEIQQNNAEIKQLREVIMSTQPGLTALTQAVTDLTTAVTAIAADVTAAATAISTAISELSGSEDPAVAAAAQSIEAQVTALNTAATALTTATASVPAPPAAS